MVKYKSPSVEDYPDTDNSPFYFPVTEKRKTEPEPKPEPSESSSYNAAESETEQPPKKMSKSSSSTPMEQDTEDSQTNNDEWNEGYEGYEEPEEQAELSRRAEQGEKGGMEGAEDVMESSGESSEETAEEPTTEYIKEPTTEGVEEPTTEYTKEPATEGAEEATAEETQEPVAEEAEEATPQSIGESTPDYPEESTQEVSEISDGEEHVNPPEPPKTHKTIEDFGRHPLEGTALAQQPLTSSADMLLAMVIDAMLKSRPISHDLSQRAVNTLINEGYHDIRKLGQSSWEERTIVLKNGGYNRYREQGATNLGDLADFVNTKYDGDLNNLLRRAGNDRRRARELIKEVKGLGDLGADLFFNNVQSVWPSMAPFVDARSLRTADEIGIGTDLEVIYESLNRDSVRMSRLANGLSHVRLDKKQRELVGF